MDQTFSKGYSLDEVVRNAPQEPGTYRFLDSQLNVLYVGKAKNLKFRLRSHLSDKETSQRHSLMLLRAKYVDWIVVPNETEALILEDVLIKKHRPDFNIELKDDKRYPIIRLNPKEKYPALTVVRRCENDGALYYGPYTSARSMRIVLKLIDKHFPMRKCKGAFLRNQRVCLNYEMKRCPGICLGSVSPEDYSNTVSQVRMLLEGKSDLLAHSLTIKMNEAAANLEYEKAAAFRDQLQAVIQISRGRKLMTSKPMDLDVFAAEIFEKFAVGIILFIRAGVISGKREQILEAPEGSTADDVMERLIIRHYNMGAPVPREILVNRLPSNLVSIETFLRSKNRCNILIHIPVRGYKTKLMRLAMTNLKHKIAASNLPKILGPDELEALKTLLAIQKRPSRIEAIDISESQGRHAVGSVVSFLNGKPEKNRYRRYKIRDAASMDDLSRINEVFRRRLERSGEENWELPDLFLIDGGKNQLNAAIAALQNFRHKEITIISLAKVRKNRRMEGIFLQSGQEINADQNSPAIKLLDRIRDEAHRFAITYHRKLRHDASMETRLLDIPGVGPYLKKNLLEHFGNLQKLKDAPLEDLTQVKGVGIRIAQIIKKALVKTNAEIC